VAGINKVNEDGVRRQDILANCRQGEHITLVLDDTNEYSETAVQVRRGNGEVIGYLPDKSENDWATYVRDEVSMGYLFDAYAYNIERKGTDVFTRLTPGTSLVTMELLLIQFDDNELSNAAGYVDSVLKEYELTPLFRPSNNITERTKVQRISKPAAQTPRTNRKIGRRERRRKEQTKIYVQLFIFTVLIGIPLIVFIFCSSVLRGS
ncbi:MAG: HIRAN domain-containing protein, partial [Planctomycetota bacterium]|nr:HIRAN domain-containing protein [Planctomycetota bacterium]